MTTKKTTHASFLLLLAPACADVPSETVGLAVQAELSSSRTVASPIVRVYDKSADVCSSPVSSLTKKRISAWDGSYIEMLIADEYVKCVSEVVGLEPKMPNGAVLEHLALSDRYSPDSPMSRIEGFITQGSCARTEYAIDSVTKTMVFPTAALEWAYRRTDPECNRQNLDEVPIAAIELPETDTSSSAPIANFLANVSKVENFSWVSGANSTIPRAFGYLYSSNVGLCFAKRLNQMLEESETFTTTTQEHLMLLGLAHEQAETSMMRLGQLLKLSARPIEETPTSNASTLAEGALLRRWFEHQPDQVNVTRKNFLSALRLTNVTSTTLATYLERQAGARWTTVSGADAFSRDWGPGSARSRLLNLVYGGGVLTDLWGDSQWLSSSPKWFTEVTSASEDPQVTVLMNLARNNDALFIRSTPGTTPPELDAASAEALYTETELGLRARECTSTNAELCTKAALRPSLPPISSASDYLLYRYYRVTLEHAKSLVGALFDSAVRHDLLTGGAQTNGSFHLTGAHVYKAPSGYSGSTDGWIKLDPKTVLVPYNYADRAQFGESILSPFTPTWDWFGASTKSEGMGYVTQGAEVGVVPALAFAREVLVQETESGRVTNTAIATDITASLSELERLIGKRSVIVRTDSIDLIEPVGIPPVQLTSPVVSAVKPGLRTAAIDASFVGPNGVKRSSLDAVNGVNPARQSTTGTLRRSSWDTGLVTEDTSSLLRWGTGSNSTYLFLGINYANRFQGYPSGTIIEEGWFVDLIQRVTEVQETDWSRPRWDGFGLPSRWVPPADASLMGGNAGEESYQYLLRSAKTAAEEATSAVKTAIDNMVAEAQDDAALQQAETKASAIASLETSALCGSSTDCRLEKLTVQFGLTDGHLLCSEVEAAGQQTCEEFLRNYKSRLPTVYLPAVVVSALAKDEPFSAADWSGSELQRVLIRIWNAARLVHEARDQAERLAVAAGAEVASAAAGVTTAEDAFAATNANIDAGIKNLNVEQNTDFVGVHADMAEADSHLAAAAERMLLHCGADFAFSDGWPSDLENAIESAKDKFELCKKQPSACFISGEGSNVLVKAGDYCKDEGLNYLDALASWSATMDTARLKLDALLDVSSTNALEAAALGAASTEAASKLVAARRQEASQRQSTLVELGAHWNVLQQTVGELALAMAELDQLVLRAGQAASRGSLEKSLAQSNYDTNASLRRKYRSYDMWRARALLESARRLAVAARRSIEARFVVDLSTLNADQAFVASPSTWADEVFESDLNAPEVVGLTQAPKVEGAIYPNKLIDYVGNLERFVQGYTITYPTSVSLPDTEVITFGGPDQVEFVSRTNVEGMSTDSKGWRFYCPTSNTWIAHPGTGQYPIVNRLATACNGSAPTLAKLGFWLDPWGSLNGAWTRPVYSDRHNVRWRRLAINLVGTGYGIARSQRTQ